jgi:hypothetical protein
MGPLDADGVLSFGQAQERATARQTAGAVGLLTVRQAVESYLYSKGADGRDIVDSRCRAVADIYPTLGPKECADLTTDQIREWHRALAKALPRTRTKPGKEQQYRKSNGDQESARRRKASANRVLTILKAALNHAFNEGKVRPMLHGARSSRTRALRRHGFVISQLRRQSALLTHAIPSFGNWSKRLYKPVPLWTTGAASCL